MESLKYFCENAPEYAVVATGSLLGVSIHEGVSFPVGKVDTLELHLMSYLEFLEAMGEKQLAELLRAKEYDVIKNFSLKYIFWLKNYYYVGGMPEVVNFFAEHKNYQEVRRLQKKFLVSTKMISESMHKPKYAVRISMLDYVEQNYLTKIPLYAVCNI